LKNEVNYVNIEAKGVDVVYELRLYLTMARKKGALPPKNKEKRKNTASWIVAASGLIAALAALISAIATLIMAMK
jgi:hypothetical protein